MSHRVSQGVAPFAVEIREITSLSSWLSWRRADITASRIGTLFDCHPFMTLDDLVADMRGHRLCGPRPRRAADLTLRANTMVLERRRGGEDAVPDTVVGGDVARG